MAYSDVQDKVSQIRMANRVLLAQGMDPNKTPETDLEGFQEQGGYAREQIGDPSLPEIDENTTVEGTLDYRKRISGGTYKGKSKKPRRKLPSRPSDADIQTEGNMRGQPTPEDIFGPDYEGGPTYLNSENLNRLLQIGGAAGSMIPFMGGNILKMLIGGPKVMAGAQDINTKMHILPSGMFVDENGIKYIWSPREQLFKDMGPYDPYYDGNPIPLGQRNTPMTIAQRGIGAPHSNVKIYEEKDYYGNTNKKVLPYYGGSRIGKIIPKKV